MKIELDAIEQLKNLKVKLSNGEMSALIGAGFSKNVSSIFPSWWELLFELADYLFGEKIREDYLNLSKKYSIKKDEYIKQKIEEYIEQYGYLEIVSMYIRRKGFRESITSYIEEKTPRIHSIGEKKYLKNIINGISNEVELTPEMLSLHKALLSLNWNNIYTTNYDEMLEESLDSADETSLEELKKDLEQKLDEHNNKLNENIQKLKILKEQQIIQQNISENSFSRVQFQAILQADNISNQDNQRVVEMLEREINFSRALITETENEVKNIKKAIYECISTITHSSKLSVKRNKNIIKLHGTLRKGGDSFGFDNDSRKHYVIAKEDYETYPQKHEAFTQLMRISLLQESYCLIGFSGVDPNFIEWIKWVRDILEKDKSNKQDYKIYLIVLGDDRQDNALQLFYENYRIFKIHLSNQDVVNFLKAETKTTQLIENDKKALLQMFVEYLGPTQISSSKVYLEQRARRRYFDLWQAIDTFDANHINYERILSNYTEIVLLKESLYNIELSSYTNRYKSPFVYNAMIHISSFEKDEVAQEKILHLILIAIDDLKQPISMLLDANTINYIEQAVAKFPQFKEIKDDLIVNDRLFRTGVFENNKYYKDLSDNQFSYYLNSLAFNFKFAELKSDLEKWHPKSPVLMLQKAGMLSNFDTNKAYSYLLENKNSFARSKAEIQLHYKELLQFVSYYQDKELNSEINKLKNYGFDSLHKNFKELLDGMHTRPEKIKKYGADRFTISNTMTFSSDSTPLTKGIQLIQLLTIFGLPTTTRSMNFIEPDDWYMIFKETFEIYPYPTVHYSLHYSDENLLRRLAQDFVFSDKLIDVTKSILPNLLKQVTNSKTPANFKKSILFFCSELLVAVDPIIWENLFYKCWQDKLFREKSLKESYSAEYIFVKSVLPYIKESSIVYDIIHTCVDQSDKPNSIEFLYHLNSNKYLKKNHSQFKMHELLSKMNMKIPQLKNEEFLWYIFINLSQFISSSQKREIKEILADLDFKIIKNERTWKILLYFAKQDEKIINKIKNEILYNNQLWNAGFNNDGSLTSNDNFISLNRIRINNPTIWNKEDDKLIYEKLVDEFEKIKNWNLRRGDQSFIFILEEMANFIENERENLVKLDGFIQKRDEILSFYNSKRGYSTLIEGLTSTDDEVVIWALAELSNSIFSQKRSDEIVDSIGILISKVLFLESSAVEACISYLVSFISDKKNDDLFKHHTNLLINILNNYKNEIPKNRDKVFVYKHMIMLAEKLSKERIKSDAINYWIKKKKENRYFYKV